MHCCTQCSQPCSRPPPTHASACAPRHPQASLRQSPVGSLLFSPGSWCTRLCCALQESISQPCVSSGSSMVGLTATSSERVYATPRSAVPRAPVPVTDRETVETVSDFTFLGSKITADGDCSHEIKRRLLLGRKVTTNLDSILKSRDITLPTNVHLVKAMVFPVVMHGGQSWIVKKAEHRKIDAFEL